MIRYVASGGKVFAVDRGGKWVEKSTAQSANARDLARFELALARAREQRGQLGKA